MAQNQINTIPRDSQAKMRGGPSWTLLAHMIPYWPIWLWTCPSGPFQYILLWKNASSAYTIRLLAHFFSRGDWKLIFTSPHDFWRFFQRAVKNRQKTANRGFFTIKTKLGELMHWTKPQLFSSIPKSRAINSWFYMNFFSMQKKIFFYFCKISFYHKMRHWI